MSARIGSQLMLLVKLCVLGFGAAATTPFQILAIGERQFDGSAALAVQFSQPLTGTQDLTPYLNVNEVGQGHVAGAWVLGPKKRVLYFTDIEAEREYEVSVFPGIASARGAVIADPMERTVKTRKVTPGASFASNGLILPKTLARGLPVVSVNVAAVDIEFFRVPPERIGAFFGKVAHRAMTAGPALREIAKLAEPVHLGRFELTAERNRRVRSLIPVLTLEALDRSGLYVAVLREPGQYRRAYSTNWFVVSDIGLMARRYRDGIQVFAHSLESAVPMQGVTVSLLDRDGEILDQAPTGADGRRRLHADDRGRLLLAHQDGQIAVLPLTGPALDVSEYPVQGRGQREHEIFVYGPRDLYRPGETAEFAALLRDYDGRISANVGIPLHAKLIRPDGKTDQEFIWRAQQLGYFQRAVTLPADGPTGQWLLELRLDPAAKLPLRRYPFNVETFLPERLRLTLNAAQPSLAPTETLMINVSGAWRHGAPAAGHRLDAVRHTAPQRYPVAALPQFFIGDVDDGARVDREDLGSNRLDSQGRARIRIAGLAATPASPQQLTVIASLFETGGRAVTRRISRTLWPAAALPAVRPLFKGRATPQAEAAFEIIMTNAQGERLAGDGLAVQVIREARDYYWVHDPDRGWRTDYHESHYPVHTQTVDLATGQGFELRLPVDWGRYRLEVTDPASGFITRYRFEAGWHWAQSQDIVGGPRPEQVALRLDKPAYTAGDKARLTVTAPHPGEALVLVESDRLLWSGRLPVNTAPATLNIPIGADWDRHDIYITAVVLRPGSRTARMTPQRAMGIAHLPLDRRPRQLQVSLAAPPQVDPQHGVTVKVNVAGLTPPANAPAASPAFVTLAAVDTGALTMTDFRTPDAGDWFFAQRRFEVEGRDVYGSVIEGADGRLARQRFGGDLGLAGGRPPTATAARIVSLFSGLVALDADGNADIPLKLPDFNGELRLMALAFDQTRYGSSEHIMTVASPVVADLSLPRFLAPGDQSTLTLNLHNRSGTQQTLALALTGDSPIAVEPLQRRVTLEDGQRETLRWPIAAAGGWGTGKIRLSLDGVGAPQPPGAAAIAVRREHDLAIRPAAPGERRRRRGLASPGQTVELDSALTHGLHTQTVQTDLSLSNTLPINLTAHLNSVLTYPYHCLEQTASRTFAWLTTAADADRDAGLTTGDENAQQRRDAVAAGITRILGLQKHTGGFGLWDDGDAEEPWLTPYATHALLNAARAGHFVPERRLTQALQRLAQTLRRNQVTLHGATDDPKHLAFAAKAYAAYVTAQAQAAPLSALRRLYDQERAFAASGLPLVHLGLALQLQGDQRRGGRALLEGVNRPHSNQYLGDYGSALRDTALMLALIKAHELEDKYLAPLVQRLAEQLADPRRLSTQEHMAVLQAGRALAAQPSAAWRATWAAGAQSETLSRTGSLTRRLPAQALAQGATLTNTGDTALYYALHSSGYPTAAPPEDTDPVTVQRTWHRADGRPLKPGAPLRVGDLLVAQITAASDRDLEHALVVDLLPAGLEIENLNLSDGESVQSISIAGKSLDHQDFRTPIRYQAYRADRFVAALPLTQGVTAHLFYLVRAVTPGDYAAPQVLVEDMYRPSLRALSAPTANVLIKP